MVYLDAGSVSWSAAVVQAYAALWAVLYALALCLSYDFEAQCFPFGRCCSRRWHLNLTPSVAVYVLLGTHGVVVVVRVVPAPWRVLGALVPAWVIGGVRAGVCHAGAFRSVHPFSPTAPARPVWGRRKSACAGSWGGRWERIKISPTRMS